MQGTTLLFILVATIATAPGLVQGRTISSSFMQELARLLSTVKRVDNLGNCQLGCCVEIHQENDNGNVEVIQKLLNLEESVGLEDPCDRYVCQESGLVRTQVTCSTAPCDNGKPPVLFPGNCCPTCEPQLEEGTCEFTEWSDFGECSITCGGGGRQVRVRQIIQVDDGGSSINCSGNLTEFRDCGDGGCPRRCLWEEVIEGSCVPNCGGGQIRKSYRVTQQPINGGEPCPPFIDDVEVTQCCQNCESVESCGPCSVTCNGGTRTCTQTILKPALEGGRECPGPRPDICNENVICPVDCEYEDVCGPCQRDCTRTCTPRIITLPQGDGRECPTTRVENCDPRDCPVDCEWEERTEGSCLPNCGGGQITKTYVITRQPRNGGDPCPAIVVGNEGVPRIEQCCQDCEFEEKCGTCESLTGRDCGAGAIRCEINIIKRSEAGGKACPTNSRPKDCDLGICPLCNEQQIECRLNGEVFCIDDRYTCACVLTELNPTIDIDGDYIKNECDNCRFKRNTKQEDVDMDRIGDECDNCINTPNENQRDDDYDDIGDACDDSIGLVSEQEDAGDKKTMVMSMMQKLLAMYYNE